MLFGCSGGTGRGNHQLRLTERAWFRYQPGQFLTLELPVPSGTVSRTYTISSSPSRPLTISITVKAQSGSIGTRWMLDHLRPGMRIRARGPAGIFTIPMKGGGKSSAEGTAAGSECNKA